jgi:IPT/TIG domain
MFPRLAARFLLLASLLLLVAAPAASAAASKAPKITTVSPMRVKVGGKLTIRGKNFSSKRSRNTVFFRGAGGTSLFVKPIRASRTKLVVKVPAKIARLLKRSSGNAKATRIKIRVLTKKFSKYTSSRISPVVSGVGVPRIGTPGSPGGTGGSSGPTGSGPAVASCVGADPDHDLLSNATESQIGTDGCDADTDNDGVGDGFEYKSAVDLNNDEYQEPNSSLPYPGKKPYPNPLDAGDANTDYDGDSLSMSVEQRLWTFSTTAASRTLFPLTYSDGMQYSVYSNGPGDRRQPALPAAGYTKQTDFVNWATGAGYRNVYIPFQDSVYGIFDINLDHSESGSEGLHFDRNGDGWLSDEERDEDADGLSNYDEVGGRMDRNWWNSCYSSEASESPYYIEYAATDFDNPDSDGDGVRDGADDQDHDDLPNLMELSRIQASGINDTEPGKGECHLAQAIKDALPNDGSPKLNHDSAYGRVQPFNPCLPVTNSRTCNHYPSFGAAWAPFDDSVDWASLN